MLGKPYVRMTARDLKQFANNEGGYRIGAIEVGNFGTREVMARYCYGGERAPGGWTGPVEISELFAHPVALPLGADASVPTAFIDEDGLFPHPKHDAIDLAEWRAADNYRDPQV